MANHHIKTDPFAKLALIVGLALIALTLFVLLNSLNNTIEKNTVKGEIDTVAIADNQALLTAVNLKPIGDVTLSDGSGAAPSTTRSGEDVYNSVCAACHNSGAAGAPKIDDKAAWESRVANGFDALLNTAINGKGAMPARGGQNVPDDELTAAITYMTKKAGFSLETPKAEKAADTTAAEAPTAIEEKATDTMATETKTTEAPTATEEEATDTTATEAKTTEAPTATEEEATDTTATEEKTTEAPTVTEEKAADTTATEEKKPEIPTAPEAATTTEKLETPTAPAKPATEEKAAETIPPAPKVEAPVANSIDGKQLYKTICFACHDTGAANAPKLTDKAVWQPRLALGKEALYNTAINGKAAMPPKGGNMALSDNEVKAIVDYMISATQ